MNKDASITARGTVDVSRWRVSVTSRIDTDEGILDQLSEYKEFLKAAWPHPSYDPPEDLNEMPVIVTLTWPVKWLKKVEELQSEFDAIEEEYQAEYTRLLGELDDPPEEGSDEMDDLLTRVGENMNEYERHKELENRTQEAIEEFVREEDWKSW